MNPVLLVVMDGVGLRDEKEGNAFRQADTPNLNNLMQDGYEELEASGPAVGLPEGYTGNSEVGHLHMGAGRRVPQRLTRINQTIEDGELRNRDALAESLEKAEKNSSTVHFAGIVSDGGIHGHIDHLEVLMEIASEYDVDVKIHCFTDGRDVAPKSAEKFLDQVKEFCDSYGGEITTVMGRFYSMDRDNNWKRTHKAYRAMAEAEGFEFEDPSEAVEKCYEDGDYDYFIQPSVAKGYEGMKDDDYVIFYNFRADRERQIEEELVDEDPEGFDDPVHPNFVSMFPYEKEISAPSIFEKNTVENTLGEKIENAGMSQLRVAESQKRPHVTYFFNGQRELKFEHEDREFIKSDKIKAYDQKPEMHADQTTDIVLEAIKDGEYDFILLNYANGDLVGHTGDMDASITAVETVDRNVGRLVEAVKDSDYGMIVTADHGNCENLGTEEESKTSHTLNSVPLIGVDLEIGIQENELWEIEKLIEEIIDLPSN